MNKKEISVEKLLYLVALLLAAWIRFTSLGKIPLSEKEAYLANQALNSFAPNASISSNVFSIFPNGLLFSLIKSSEFLGRFFPALFGTFFVIFPYFYKELLGRKTALVLSFLLVFDPLLIASSRQIGTPIITLFLFLTLITSLYKKKWDLSAITLAIYFLSGADAFHGLVISFLFFTVFYIGNKKKELSLEINKKSSIRFILFFFLTYVSFGTLLFIIPQGISGAISGMIDWFFGWGKIGVFKIPQLIMALPIYQPIAILFGLIYLVKTYMKELKFERYLGLFSIISFASRSDLSKSPTI